MVVRILIVLYGCLLITVGLVLYDLAGNGQMNPNNLQRVSWFKWIVAFNFAWCVSHQPRLIFLFPVRKKHIWLKPLDELIPLYSRWLKRSLEFSHRSGAHSRLVWKPVYGTVNVHLWRIVRRCFFAAPHSELAMQTVIRKPQFLRIVFLHS